MHADLECGPQIVRKGYLALKNGSWEEFTEECKEKEVSSEWTLEKFAKPLNKCGKR